MSVLIAPLEVLRPSAPGSSRRVNVLTLAPFFPSVEDPAQGCFIAEPIRRMSQQEIDSHVIAVNPFYRGVPRASEADSEWRRYYAVPGNLGLVTSGDLLAWSLRARVRELQKARPIDLIHAHAALPCGEAALSIAAELKVPCVVSVHGLDVFADRQCGGWLGAAAKRLSVGVYRRAKRVVCISEKVRRQLPDDLQSNAQVVYNGVDAQMFSPAPEADSPARILSVGNLIPTKGHASLLRAFAQALKVVPDIQLEIIGDGPERARLEHLAGSLQISSRVIFRGRQDRLAVASAMQSCAVFALPSRYEGLGCVYLEAMACAKPVIACTAQGIDEIIEDRANGLLVAPGDEKGLTDRLLALLQDGSLRHRLGVAARGTVLQRCTLDHQARALAEIYRECVA